eukprot:937824-Amphidinium_carterae.1
MRSALLAQHLGWGLADGMHFIMGHVLVAVMALEQVLRMLGGWTCPTQSICSRQSSFSPLMVVCSRAETTTCASEVRCVARLNTAIYEELFGVLPSDQVRTWSDLSMRCNGSKQDETLWEDCVLSTHCIEATRWECYGSAACKGWQCSIATT